MNVLLVNANRYRDPVAVMPLGLCSVASSLVAAGYRVRLLDLAFSVFPARAIRQAVESFRPDLVGLGVRNIDNSGCTKALFLLDETRRTVAEPLRSVFKGPIVLGGAPAGINGPEALEFLGLEYAVQGDGERAMVEIARRLETGLEPRGIPGLVVRREGRVVESNPPDFIPDVDALPRARPQAHLRLLAYRLHGSPFLVQTKRGCPLGCAYCTYNRLEGTRYRLRSPAAIADEVEEFVRQTGMRRVEIVDSTFNVPLDHAKAVLRELVARRLRLRLSTMGLHPLHFDEELAELMKRAGFMEACFGVESVCAETLRTLGKNFTPEHVRAAARTVHATGIPASWFILLGAPGETVATVRETLRSMARIASRWDFVNIGIGIRVYNGAPIADDWKRLHGGEPPADNFLHPVAFEPADAPVRRIKAEAALATARNHNFFMFEEGANIPLPFRLLFHALCRRQPIWRAYVAYRLLEKLTGLFVVRALVTWLFYRNDMTEAPAAGALPPKA